MLPDAEAVEEELAGDAEAEPTLQASDALALPCLRYTVQPPTVLARRAALREFVVELQPNLGN